MTYQFSATLEFETSAPETVRGVLTAASHPSAMRDATKQLLKAFPGRRPTSIVVCLLEIRRDGNDTAEVEAQP
jgi:hypothetical protein